MRAQCRGDAIVIAALFLLKVAAEDPEDILACEAAQLQVSLLQSSLTVARRDRAEAAQDILLDVPVAGGIQPSWLWQVESLAYFGRAAQTAMVRHMSLIRQLTLPTDKTAVSGLPALIVFMVAALVMVLFVSQMMGTLFEDRNQDSYSGYPAQKSWPADFRGSYGPAGSYGPDGQERSTLGPGSLPPMTLPNSPGISHDIGQGVGSAASTLPVMSQGRLSEPPHSTSFGPAAAPDRAAMCPRLIQPLAEAQFHVTSDGLRSLRQGSGPVGICGPQGRALLFARFGQDGKSRSWLELSTTASTQYPHCRAGPLRLGAETAGVALDIRGPTGDRYGLLQNCGQHWQMQRAEGVVLMSIGASGTGGGLTAMASDQVVATAWPEGEVLLVKVSPGRDPLLALLCMLVITLLSPELSGFR
mmetsp:Transcript_34813/g.64789  ORF Transcript_34813/g.64789 Transcript_34813/m.64789 type:complete len:415 (-) Transcript_34813:47-1291(-)